MVLAQVLYVATIQDAQKVTGHTIYAMTLSKFKIMRSNKAYIEDHSRASDWRNFIFYEYKI